MSSAAEHVVVDGEMTIYRVTELKPLLLARPAHAQAVALALSRVSEVDTAGVAQTVIKPLSKVSAEVRGISGSSIRGAGEVALILDVPALVPQAAKHPPVVQRHTA